MWACRHPLDGGDDEADRMTSVYLTSADGLAWTEAGTALAPTPGTLGRARRPDHQRRAQRRRSGWRSTTAARAPSENWFERTGVARRRAGPRAVPGRRRADAAGPHVRYVSLAETPTGTRLYWEASRSDGANDLRTAYVPRPLSPSQS